MRFILVQLMYFIVHGQAENVTVRDLVVKEGKSMQIECDSNIEPPFYYYRFHSQTIHLPVVSSMYPWWVSAVDIFNTPTNLQTNPILLGRNEQPLKIRNVTVEFDNNMICCNGVNTVTRQSSDQNTSLLSTMICHHIHVQFSPKVIRSSIKFSYDQWILPLHPSYGEEVVISCPLEGNPPTSYQWYFNKYVNDDSCDDDRILIKEESYNPKLLNNNRTMYFSDFKEEQNGCYICTAKNSLGSRTYMKFPQIKVNKCNAFQPARPSVTIDASDNLVAYVGDDLSIDCIVASLPNILNNAIRWYKYKEEVLALDDRVYYTKGHFDEDHCRIITTLSIKNLTFEDSGNYTCADIISDENVVNDSILLTVTTPAKQPEYKSLILKISIPVSVVVMLSAIFVVLGFFYYQHMRQVKLQQALEEYHKRPLPKKGDYQYEFFFAMTEEDKDKLEVDKLYVVLKQSFSIYYQLDQYLPGRTKVEMVTEGIKNSRFIVMMLSKAYLQQKDEIIQLELAYIMNRIEKELTKCAFIVTLEDNLFIPYKLRHITKFSKEGADNKLRELALSSDTYGPEFCISEGSTADTVQSNDNTMALELLSND